MSLPVLTHSELDTLLQTTLHKDMKPPIRFISIRAKTHQNDLNKGRGRNAMVETINVNPDLIYKLSHRVAAITGYGTVSYKDFVKNRILKESDVKDINEIVTFEPKEHRWGKLLHKDFKAILTHPKNGGRYLILYLVANNEDIAEYIYKGKPIDLTEARFDPYRKPAEEEGSTTQGTKKKIKVRDFDFHNLKKITMDGVTYKVVPDPE